MSLLAALSTGEPGPVVDPILGFLRPAEIPAYQTTVDPGVTSTVLAPAVAAGDAATGVGPFGRYKINMNPGTYDGQLDLPGSWSQFIGMGESPADTILQSNGQNLGSFYSHAGVYLENLTLRAFTSDASHSPRYPWHMTLGQMVVAANCIFDASEAAPQNLGAGTGTGGVVGADGESAMSIIFYKCTFKRGAGVSTISNLHGPVPWDTPPAEPMTVCFIDCVFEGGGELAFESIGSIDGRNDKFYVIGCPTVESINGVNYTYPATLGKTSIYTDSATVPVSGYASLERGVTDWPIPDGGLSAFWKDFYY